MRSQRKGDWVCEIGNGAAIGSDGQVAVKMSAGQA